MLAQKIYQKHGCGVSEVIRHIILGWLVAATLEYLFLPRAYRNLAGLEGLKAMSFVRVLGFALGIALLFTGLSRALGFGSCFCHICSCCTVCKPLLAASGCLYPGAWGAGGLRCPGLEQHAGTCS